MTTRFKQDENLPRAANALLRDAGHDVRTAIEERLGGGYDNHHGRHHRHDRGRIESVDFTSFEEIEARFESEWLKISK